MTKFYIPNPSRYLNLTTTSLTINKQQISNLLIWCFKKHFVLLSLLKKVLQFNIC